MVLRFCALSSKYITHTYCCLRSNVCFDLDGVEYNQTLVCSPLTEQLFKRIQSVDKVRNDIKIVTVIRVV